jgi:acetyl-CoA acetyltransferase
VRFSWPAGLFKVYPLAMRPERIVSLVPSLTEALFALGAGSRVVGRVAKVRGTKKVDVECVLDLESGMQSVTLVESMIRCGDHAVVLTGGMERMSNAPYLLPEARWGAGMGDARAGPMVDAMIHDGLLDAFEHVNRVRVARPKVAEEPPNLHSAPGNAGKRALEKAGWSAADLDLVETNEAFAAVAINASRILGVSGEIVNLNGGAVSLGHLVGASGARILTTVCYEPKRGGVVGAWLPSAPAAKATPCWWRCRL